MLIFGVGYGILGFAAGFVFGAIREVLLIPAFGDVAGRWIEFLPLVVVIFLLGRSLTIRIGITSPLKAILFGATGVATLLILESGFALLVLGMPPAEYMAGFDVTQGALFPFGLLIMLLAPLMTVIGQGAK